MPHRVNRRRRKCIPIRDMKVGYKIKRRFNDRQYYTGEIIEEAKELPWDDGNPDRIRCTVRYHFDGQLEYPDEDQLNLWYWDGPIDQSREELENEEERMARAVKQEAGGNDAKKKKAARSLKKKKKLIQNKRRKEEALKKAEEYKKRTSEAYHRSVLLENQRYKKKAKVLSQPPEGRIDRKGAATKKNDQPEADQKPNHLVESAKVTGTPRIKRKATISKDDSNNIPTGDDAVPNVLTFLTLLMEDGEVVDELEEGKVASDGSNKNKTLEANLSHIGKNTENNDATPVEIATVTPSSNPINKDVITPRSLAFPVALSYKTNDNNSNNKDGTNDAKVGLTGEQDEDSVPPSSSSSSDDDSINADIGRSFGGEKIYRLSRYEMKRERAIERNRQRILELGLVDETSKASKGRSSSSSSVYRYETERASDDKNKSTDERLDGDNASDNRRRTRTSKRLNKENQDETSDRDVDGPLADGRVDGPPPDEDGYYEVDEILNRRMVKRAGGKEIVQYLVRWKGYPNPSWEVAEFLNPNILGEAHLKFPTAFDPDRLKVEAEQKTPTELIEQMVYQNEDVDDDISSSSSEEEESEDENDDFLSIAASDEARNEISEEEADDNYRTKALNESQYDKVGTVELVLNRKCYRVGQSFICDEKALIYTISKLIPKELKAICDQYIRFEDTFTCPKGCEGAHVRLKEQTIVDLEKLKKPYRDVIQLFPLIYHQDEKQRAFCYYNKEGEVKNHFPRDEAAVLDLYAGIGGMSLGFENAGFEIKWAVENAPLAAATYQANANLRGSRRTQLFQEDVKSFLRRSEQRDPSYPSPDRNDVHHVHASTPCKGFSRANRYGGKDDVRNNKQTSLFIESIRLFQPMTATFENVPGLVLNDYKGYLQYMVSSLITMEYQVRVSVLNASSYGDPQNRQRVILWAARKDCILPTLPAETHGDPETSDDLMPVKTCKDALRYLEDFQPVNGSKSSGAVSMNGSTIYNHVCPRLTSREKVKTSQNIDNYVLQEDMPSRTVLARARPHVHYNGQRFISVREAASLQSFPPSFQFFGGTANQLSQVGNAVPICLATAIARSVAKSHGLP